MDSSLSSHSSISLLMAFALLAIGMLLNVWLTGLMLVVFGACTIAIDVASNMNGVAIERKTKRSLMSGFHGGYSLGTLIGAGAMSVLFTLGIIPAWAVVICTLCLPWRSAAEIYCQKKILQQMCLKSGHNMAGCLSLPRSLSSDCSVSSCMPPKAQ